MIIAVLQSIFPNTPPTCVTTKPFKHAYFK